MRNMRSLPVAAVAILLFSSWGMATEPEGKIQTIDTETSAQLKLDSAYIDLGDIKADTITEAALGFCNTGSAPLYIERIFSDCGCTVASYPRHPVAPGESGKITVRFNSHHRSKGTFRKTLRIRSNATEPRVSFTIKGRITTP